MTGIGANCATQNEKAKSEIVAQIARIARTGWVASRSAWGATCDHPVS